MVPESILQRRLVQQQLTMHGCATPEAVVAWFGAVQAQDYYGAKWSLGLRLPNALDVEIEEAFTAGRILRTHIMRPTWHFVTPDDIRWIMELTAARVHQISASMYRQLELDAHLLARSNQIIAEALTGGIALTRNEIGHRLAIAGIAASGLRLAYMLHCAELDLVVCSGPRQGKQFTYMRLDERVPPPRTWTRDEAVAELTLRYFRGHGPATLHDFARWSGLTLADARAGAEMMGARLVQESVEGITYWSTALAHVPPGSHASADAGATSGTFLLPTYDEYFIGYTDFGPAATGGRPIPQNMVILSPIMVDGKTVGTWRRTVKRKEVLVELAPFDPLTPTQQAAMHAAAARYAKFLELPVTVQIA